MLYSFCLFIHNCYKKLTAIEVTTWPRMDNDPPGSWNGVVQTPLRKLWVECQRVATSMSKRHGLFPRAGYASLLTQWSVASTPSTNLMAPGSGSCILGWQSRGSWGGIPGVGQGPDGVVFDPQNGPPAGPPGNPPKPPKTKQTLNQDR